MTPIVQSVTNLFSAGIIVIQILTILIIASLLVKRTEKFAKLSQWAGKYGLELGLLMSLGSVVVSHFYSLYAGFEPCEFCWWARILIFPQAVMFAVALCYRKKGISDRAIVTSALILSIIGAVLMAFQYYSQMFDPSLLAACVANGPSCTMLYFVTFGYITIPMMAFTGFVFNIVVMLARKRI
jgi:disulfide bond formation protein DsbB